MQLACHSFVWWRLPQHLPELRSVGLCQAHYRFTLSPTRINENEQQRIGHCSPPQYAQRTYLDLPDRERRDASDGALKFVICSRLIALKTRFTQIVHNYPTIHNLVKQSTTTFLALEYLGSSHQMVQRLWEKPNNNMHTIECVA